MKSRQWSNNSK